MRGLAHGPPRDGPVIVNAAAILTVAVTTALIRRMEISCGCMGRLGELVSWRKVARNLMLIAVTMLSVIRTAHGAPDWPVWFFVVTSVVLATHGLTAVARARRRRLILAAITPARV